jgi:hypothetical protein
VSGLQHAQGHMQGRFECATDQELLSKN